MWQIVEVKKRCTNCGFIHTFVNGHDAQYKYCPQCGMKQADTPQTEEVVQALKNLPMEVKQTDCGWK